MPLSSKGPPIESDFAGRGYFYAPIEGKFTEDSLRKLESASKEFHALLPKNQSELAPHGHDYSGLKAASFNPAELPQPTTEAPTVATTKESISPVRINKTIPGASFA